MYLNYKPMIRSNHIIFISLASICRYNFFKREITLVLILLEFLFLTIQLEKRYIMDNKFLLNVITLNDSF